MAYHMERFHAEMVERDIAEGDKILEARMDLAQLAPNHPDRWPSEIAQATHIAHNELDEGVPGSPLVPHQKLAAAHEWVRLLHATIHDIPWFEEATEHLSVRRNSELVELLQNDDRIREAFHLRAEETEARHAVMTGSIPHLTTFAQVAEERNRKTTRGEDPGDAFEQALNASLGKLESTLEIALHSKMAMSMTVSGSNYTILETKESSKKWGDEAVIKKNYFVQRDQYKDVRAYAIVAPVVVDGRDFGMVQYSFICANDGSLRQMFVVDGENKPYAVVNSTVVLGMVADLERQVVNEPENYTLL